MEIPVSLKSDFRVLETTAFKLRKKTPGTKTNIRFRDADMSLVLDFKSPDAEWRTVTSDCAGSIRTGGKDLVDNLTLSGLVDS